MFAVVYMENNTIDNNARINSVFFLLTPINLYDFLTLTVDIFIRVRVEIF